jgi:hypothetical protein
VSWAALALLRGLWPVRVDLGLGIAALNVWRVQTRRRRAYCRAQTVVWGGKQHVPPCRPVAHAKVSLWSNPEAHLSCLVQFDLPSLGSYGACVLSTSGR